MNPLPNFDLSEATRLTRAGKLAEALAVLRGQAANAKPSGPAPTIDMAPPAAAGGAWTAPNTARPHAAADPSAAIAAALARVEVPEAVRDLLGRLGQGGVPGLDLPGSPARAPVPVPEGASFEALSFANEAGSRAYKLYVPASTRGRSDLPLVIMLHGCTQDPDDFAAGTGMNQLAEEHNCLVAYPAQSQGANASRCWNWFTPGDQGREAGEPSIIAGLTREIMRRHPVDPGRVYVAGLSAGGAAAAIMAEAYPDLYAAAGIHSGLACGAAHDLPSALQAMKQGGPSQASRARGARAVPLIVFHGDADKTVHPTNGERVAAGPAGLSTSVRRDRSPGGVASTCTTGVDAQGRPILEHWVLHGMGHAWSGGRPEGSYTDPRGPDASREMMRFFLQHRHPAHAA